MKTLSLFGTAFAVIAAIAALALAVTGCGGSSASDGQTSGDSGTTATATDTTPTTASTLTKSEFVAQADAICAKESKRVETEFAAYLKENNIKEIGENESPSETEAHQVAVIENLGIPALRKQQREIEALGLPSEEEAKVKAYLAAIGEGISEGEQNPVRLYTSAPKVFAKSDKIAGELGLKVCGNR